MRALIALAAAALAGCVTMTPQQMASKSHWDVCRFTMGGPHSGLAQQEAYRRSLDCRPYYGPIAAQQQAQNEALSNYLRAINPPAKPVQFPKQTQCTSRVVGNTVQTVCD